MLGSFAAEVPGAFVELEMINSLYSSMVLRKVALFNPLKKDIKSHPLQINSIGSITGIHVRI